MKQPPLALLQRDLEQQDPPMLPEVSGPSFPVAVKALASLLMVGLAAAGGFALTGESLGAVKALSGAQWGFLLTLVAVIASGYWGILTSRTRCDAEHIAQSWLWRKQVRVAEITQVKLIHVRGLSWLLVPRLIVRTGYGLTTFHAADPDVLQRFERLAHGERGQ